MIKDIRIVEWTSASQTPHWDIQVMYEGSDEWKPITFVKLDEQPKEISREEKRV